MRLLLPRTIWTWPINIMATLKKVTKTGFIDLFFACDLRLHRDLIGGNAAYECL